MDGLQGSKHGFDQWGQTACSPLSSYWIATADPLRFVLRNSQDVETGQVVRPSSALSTRQRALQAAFSSSLAQRPSRHFLQLSKAEGPVLRRGEVASVVAALQGGGATGRLPSSFEQAGAGRERSFGGILAVEEMEK